MMIREIQERYLEQINIETDFERDRYGKNKKSDQALKLLRRGLLLLVNILVF